MKKIIGIISATMLAFNASLANAFKFDIWESGMNEREIMAIAERNGIKLIGAETKYTYTTELLKEKAEVSLSLTRGDYKLMEVTINWKYKKELIPILKKIIEDKNPISKTFHPEYMLIAGEKYSYILEKNTSVDIESKLISFIEMKYRDLELSRLDEKRKDWEKKESQRKTIIQDQGRFFGENDKKQPVDEENKIHKWIDEKGVAHYSNMERGENSTVVNMKPVETVPLKEILWYEVRLKNGSRIKAKKIDRVSKGVLAIVERGIKTEVADNEISQVEETSQVGGKIHTELRSSDSF